MKKLRLNKLFHWLYAFLMFLPIFAFFYFFIVNFGKGVDFESFDFSQVLSPVDSYLYDFYSSSNVGKTIADVFGYLMGDIIGADSDGSSTFLAFSSHLLVYWVCISLLYLVFDVVMYLINLVHRWIDEGGI